MIKNFADKETEKIYNQEFSNKLPQTIQRNALRKLIMEIAKGNTAFELMHNTASVLEL